MKTDIIYKNNNPVEKKKTNTFFKPVTIQKKLSIGAANDAYEIEADAIADRVVAMSNSSVTATTQPGPIVQRRCTACEQEENLQMKPLADQISPLVQKSPIASSKASVASDSITSQINSSKGGGNIMENGTRNFMESRFSTDFSGVRIHTDNNAIQLSRQLHAQAFTVGNDVYFNQGKYNPSSNAGKHLLAHELVHTVQQGGIKRKIQRYYTQDCNETLDKAPHIRPADTIATSMASKAVTALSASTISASTNTILDKHFNSHSSTTVASVIAVFRRVKKALDGNKYTYECENDCDGDNAYVYRIWSDIHLCMNNLRGKNNKGIAAIIVHEFSHYYGGTDDNEYFFSFGVGSAPSTLSVSDAVDNADSYEGFAYDIY